MPTSRLDRLVILLETGSTALIRNTAAQQLADVQKQHPDELFNLLTRVVPYLRSKSWETRIAAAKAIGGIVENAEKFDPNAEEVALKTEVKKEEENGQALKTEGDGQDSASDPFRLESLDVNAVLTYGHVLLGSGNRDYSYKLGALDPAERLEFQKKTLRKRLGFEGACVEADFTPDVAGPDAPQNNTPKLAKLDTSVTTSSSYSVSSPPDLSAQTPGGEDGGLSKRQLNMLKRKNKKEVKSQANKVRVIDLATRRPSMDSPGSQPHAIKSEGETESSSASFSDYFNVESRGADDDSKLVSGFKGEPMAEKSTLVTEAEEQGLEWPFERLCEFLAMDLFDHNWEVRHGAAMGLREVVRVHGAGAGRAREKSRHQNDVANRRWLDDLACRLCCIFMLDRFGDYISDNVVAPIRETTGQTLGSVLQHLPIDSIRSIFSILHRLVMQDDIGDAKRIWQAGHGGMIGMRYLVAVRNDVLLEDHDLMDGVLNAVMKGLGDWDDDVRAVSAATLIPVAGEFIASRRGSLTTLIRIVWNCLSNLSDDLSASTGSVMDLLAKLCSFPEILDAMKQNAADDSAQSFTQLVPRLYPFLRHTITSVRSAVLRALLTFLDIKGEGNRGWISGKAVRLIYQNFLVERNDAVLKLSLKVWMSLMDALKSQGSEALTAEIAPHIMPIVTLTLSPIGVPRHPIPMDVTLFIRPSGQAYSAPAVVQTSRSDSTAGGDKKRRKNEKKDKEPPPPSTTHNIDGAIMQGDVDLVGADVMIRSKVTAAKALGKLITLWPAASQSDSFGSIIPALKSGNSSSQMIAALICQEFAQASPEKTAFSGELALACVPVAEGPRPPCYADLTSYLHVVRAQCQSLLNTFRDIAHVLPTKLPQIAVLVQGEPSASDYAFSVAQGEKIYGEDFEKLKKSLSPSQRVAATKSLDDARQDVRRALDDATTVKEQRDVRIKAAAAAALVALHEVPKKPALIIKDIMDSIKAEENLELQHRSGAAIAALIEHVAANGKRVILEKVVGNIVKFYCMETAETPEFHPNAHVTTGILSLKKEEDVRDHPDAAKFERAAKAARITRRGAKEALEQLVHRFGADLFVKIPIIRKLIEDPIKGIFTGQLPPNITDADDEAGQQLVDGLSTLRALVAKFDPKLHGFVRELMPLIVKGLQCSLSVLRYAAAKCFATICSVMTVEGITMLVESVLPSIQNANDVHCRQGAIECVYHLIHVMEDGILPYVIFLIVPVLGRMSDSDNEVRLIATTTFAHLVKLVPLEAGIPDPPGLSQKLLEGRDRERKFMAQMLDARKVEPFEIPVAIKAELRSYQQDGVNWLAFLNKYHLHGVLCDDMGLGKTLQTLCIVASDHHLRAEEFAKTGAPEVRRSPSLIVCPPTLSGHWQQEIQTYAPFLKPVLYVGPPQERSKVRHLLADADVVVTSYDICRNDIETLAPINWNYCVLDEGHLIKNPRTKASIAVKRLPSNHRLILSGTPIQNNVLELWSLFDFLMPGFLGTEKVFQDRFAKPIAASRFSKSSSREQEAGALAIEALHKQVLPFLLRRLKEEVLDDLPPKILQNYYCDLSELQRKLFQDFTKKEGKSLADKAASQDRESKQHIFQALQYMRKLCNSPALVMKPGHKQYEATQRFLSSHNTSLRDPTHAPKLLALRDLLVDCGIGSPLGGNGMGNGADSDHMPPAASEAVSQHRALVFCQMKEMLDMVQDEVLGKLLPGVQYMRLDGSVEASKRQDIVNRFNTDPSYDVLLLTTSVGGLGLNLTGADTVIFVEHDWNPQKDMQAMDRAHRIGQKKVVNVYRIVTRGTLEEKILNLQRFKIDVASTVVNQQNAGLGSMETDQILDLFTLSDPDGVGAPPPPGAEDGGSSRLAGDGQAVNEDDAVDATGEVREKGKRGFLDDLGDLWDEKQYEDEFDFQKFLSQMHN